MNRLLLTKPMLTVLIEVVKGVNSIGELAKSLNKSQNWISEIITKLEIEGFITKKRIKLKKEISLANTQQAQLFKEMIYKQVKINYSRFLFGEKLRILAFIADSPKNTECIAKELKISRKFVQNTIPLFLKRGIIFKEKRMLKISRKAWHLLIDFLLAYRNNSELKAGRLWKFEEETVFMVNEKEEINGTLTGFNKYEIYGIKHYPLKIMCYLPEKKLSKEEIFVHSLLGIRNDVRLFSLAVSFYLKNKRMSLKKINYLAMKYGVLEHLEDILTTINTKEEIIQLKTTINIKRTNLIRILKMYGVKLNVK